MSEAEKREAERRETAASSARPRAPLLVVLPGCWALLITVLVEKSDVGQAFLWAAGLACVVGVRSEGQEREVRSHSPTRRLRLASEQVAPRGRSEPRAILWKAKNPSSDLLVPLWASVRGSFRSLHVPAPTAPGRLAR
jgi:hypothetical protein